MMNTTPMTADPASDSQISGPNVIMKCMQAQIGNNVGNKPISAMVRLGRIHLRAIWET